jgi:hypothetical protein
LHGDTQKLSVILTGNNFADLRCGAF